jgi:hypothetical protein
MILRKNYRTGSNWNLILILPLVCLSFFIISCSVKSVPKQTYNEIPETSVPVDSKVYIIAEDMPAFLSNDTVIGYPKESRYELENSTEVGIPSRSPDFPTKENILKPEFVLGYPIVLEGFSKRSYNLKNRTVVGIPSKSPDFPTKENILKPDL